VSGKAWVWLHTDGAAGHPAISLAAVRQHAYSAVIVLGVVFLKQNLIGELPQDQHDDGGGDITLTGYHDSHLGQSAVSVAGRNAHFVVQDQFLAQ